MSTETQRVEQYWAAFFGMQREDFLRPGITVIPHAKLNGYHGAWSLRHGASLTVSVPSKLLKVMRARCAGLTVGHFQEPETTEAVFADWLSMTVGPAFQGHLVPGEFAPYPLTYVRRIVPEDGTCLQRLKTTVDPVEWEYSALAVDDQTVFGCFLDGLLVSACKNLMRSEDAADHGVVTHPNYRGRGFGKAAVSASVSHALDQDYLVIYQTLTSNAASVKIAQSLGLRQYGQSLAVRFTTESA